jgi:hypothetical protein
VFLTSAESPWAGDGRGGGSGGQSEPHLELELWYTYVHGGGAYGPVALSVFRDIQQRPDAVPQGRQAVAKAGEGRVGG